MTDTPQPTAGDNALADRLDDWATRFSDHEFTRSTWDDNALKSSLNEQDAFAADLRAAAQALRAQGGREEEVGSSRDHAHTASIALEFAGYLANAADTYLDFMATKESEIDFDARNDLFKGLRCAVYEYRKRAPSSAKQVDVASSRDEHSTNTAPPSPVRGGEASDGQRIIDGLQDVLDGNIARVTRFVSSPPPDVNAELVEATSAALDYIDHGCWITPDGPKRPPLIAKLRLALSRAKAAADGGCP